MWSTRTLPTGWWSASLPWLPTQTRPITRWQQEEEEEDVAHRTALNTLIASTIFTAGYLSWLLRGGALQAYTAAAQALWTDFDPLPVIDSKHGAKPGAVAQPERAGP